VQELRQQHPIPALLKAAGLARSTFYYQLNVMGTGDRHKDLKTRIKAVYERHRGRHGYRRITAAIRQAGQSVNHKTVQRLMGQLKLKSLVRPKKYRLWRGEAGRIAPNLLNREFSAQQPNQKWVPIAICATVRSWYCMTTRGCICILPIAGLHHTGNSAYY
jgi:hypothetical protein